MRLGLIGPDVPGHMNPLTSLGSELQSRGHQVTLFGFQSARRYAQRHSLLFAEIPVDQKTEQAMEVAWARLARSSRIRSMMVTGQIFGMVANVHKQALASVFDQHPIDALVIDQLSPAAFQVAQQRGIPMIIVSNALALYWDKYLVPPPTTWGYRRDWVGRLRTICARIAMPPLYYLLANVHRTGADPFMLVWDGTHGLARLAQQPAFFDFPREPDSAQFDYTGPWHRPARDDESTDFPWDWLDGRPLIYASMGTLQNGIAKIFRQIIDAVAGMDVQVVLSRGGGHVEVPAQLPKNVLVVDFAPQLRLLQRASLAITHAGLNTALECLAAGVPMLCIPITNDQPGVAKRVEWIGAGQVLLPRQATAPRIRQALESLRQPFYAERAKWAQAEMAKQDGLTMAADIIERALNT